MRRSAGPILLMLALVGCGHDAAEQEYLAALRGEEDGSTRADQIRHLDAAIQLEPSRPRYWETRAIYRIDLREFATAERDLDRAIELGDRPYLRFLRGLVRCQGGEPQRSLADFDLAIASQPENSQFYRGRSLARSALGLAQPALEDAEHLIAVAPQVAEGYYARAMALSALHRDREALPDLDRALDQRPELVFALRARADLHQRLGNDAQEAADRRQLAQALEQHGNCAVCVDPFRY